MYLIHMYYTLQYNDGLSNAITNLLYPHQVSVRCMDDSECRQIVNMCAVYYMFEHLDGTTGFYLVNNLYCNFPSIDSFVITIFTFFIFFFFTFILIYFFAYLKLTKASINTLICLNELRFYFNYLDNKNVISFHHMCKCMRFFSSCE